MALLIFSAVSLLAFNAADPPTHAVYPVNERVANLCGPAGAWVASSLYRIVGFPVWIVLAGVGTIVVAPLFGRAVAQPTFRVIGAIIIAAALAGVNALVLPRMTPTPGLAGGLLGEVLAGELALRFHTVGSLVWLTLMLVVGGLVALDRYMVTAPVWAWRRAAPAARAAGRVAGNTARGTGTVARAASGSLLDRLSSAVSTPRPVEAAAARPTGARSVEIKSVGRPVARRAAAASAGRVERIPVARPVEPEDGTDEDEVPGAPQIYSEQELREKISRLPIRFGGESRRSATAEDLQDLQNVAELEGYRFPGLDLLEDPEANFTERLESHVREQAEALEAALQEYRIRGEVAGIESGPVITLYHVRLAPGTRVSALEAVSKDIARSLRAVNIRIVPNQVGKDTVGIEVPNSAKEKVRLKELMSSPEKFQRMRLPMFLGKDAAGDPLIGDLTTMPHMLIAGTTGSGKSVCMNTIIMSFLYTKKPNELKLVLVDPKMVEMSQFKDIPHLMCPVVTEMSKAAAILEWAVTKMDERYEILAEAGCRDIAGYNELTWDELKDRMQPQSPEEEARIPRRLPYMVFIIDELADLMMTHKEVEGSIIRIAQKARAVGIHLILATQRPQANVVTGLIKSNMPCRVAFKVASGMDSRIVLDQKGGELLLGQGDMLFLSPHSHKLIRAQGTLVDDSEIRRVVRFMRDVARPSFERQLIQLKSVSDDEQRLLDTENHSSASLAAAQEDPLFDRAVEIVLQTKRGSVSLLQRRLAIGYTRASRLIDLMGIAGIISDHKGSVARDVMITPEQWEEMKRLAQEQAEPGAQRDLFAPTLPGTNGLGEPLADDHDMEIEEEDDGEAEDEYVQDEDEDDAEAEDEYEQDEEDDDAEAEDEYEQDEEDDDTEAEDEYEQDEEDDDAEAEDEYEQDEEDDDAEAEDEYQQDEDEDDAEAEDEYEQDEDDEDAEAEDEHEQDDDDDDAEAEDEDDSATTSTRDYVIELDEEPNESDADSSWDEGPDWADVPDATPDREPPRRRGRAAGG
ncbi:MAG: DNA translocase FtsK 4TM domain-containing protein [Phycisphaeraceae bacterium]|nr:DNA translocase FtsK 4TM domain-containing protein [Phycisphaeraceae bacterium]